MASSRNSSSRRSFFRAGLAASTITPAMFGQQTSPRSQGDMAILRFSMLTEIVAADIWSQMADMLAANAAMRSAFGGIDPLLPRILNEIARNERSHAEFLTAYYNSISGQPAMNLAQYQTLPTGATIGSAICAENASVGAGGAIPRPGSGTGTGGTGSGGTGTGGTGTGGTGSGGTGTGGTGAGGTGTGTGGTGTGGSGSGSGGSGGGAFADSPFGQTSSGNIEAYCIPRETGWTTAVPGMPTGRLTNLTAVNIDTSWFYRYRTPVDFEAIGPWPTVQAGIPLTAVNLVGQTTGGSGTGGTGTGGTGTGGTGTGGTGTGGTGTGGTGTGGTGTGGTGTGGTGTGGTGTGGTGTGGTGTGGTGTGGTGTGGTGTGGTGTGGSGTGGTGTGGTGTGGSGTGGTGTGGTGTGGTGTGGTGTGGTGTGGTGTGGTGTGSGGGSGSGSGGGGGAFADAPNGQTGTGGTLGSPAMAQAALLFASMMEAMETSTYLSLSTRIQDVENLRLMGSIFPVEFAHYAALQVPLIRMLENLGLGDMGDASTGVGNTGGTGGTTSGGYFSLAFPFLSDPNYGNRPAFAASVLPTPAAVMQNMPFAAVVRPSRMTATQAVEAMVRANIFQGQPSAFLDMMRQAAADADAAMRRA